MKNHQTRNESLEYARKQTLIENKYTYFTAFIQNSLFVLSYKILEYALPAQTLSTGSLLGYDISSFSGLIFAAVSFSAVYLAKTIAYKRSQNALAKLSVGTVCLASLNDLKPIRNSLAEQKIEQLKSASNNWLTLFENDFFKQDKNGRYRYKRAGFYTYQLIENALQPSFWLWCQSFFVPIKPKHLSLNTRLKFLEMAIETQDINGIQKILYDLWVFKTTVPKEDQDLLDASMIQKLPAIANKIKLINPDQYNKIADFIKNINKSPENQDDFYEEINNKNRFNEFILNIQSFFSLSMISSASALNFKLQNLFASITNPLFFLMISLGMIFLPVAIIGGAIGLAFLVNLGCKAYLSQSLKKQDLFELIILQHHKQDQALESLIAQKARELSLEEWEEFRKKIFSQDGQYAALIPLMKDFVFKKCIYTQLEKQKPDTHEKNYLAILHETIKNSYFLTFFWPKKSSMPQSIMIDFMEDALKNNNAHAFYAQQKLLMMNFWPKGADPDSLKRLNTLYSELDISHPHRALLARLCKTQDDPVIQKKHDQLKKYQTLVAYEKVKETLDLIFFPVNSLLNSGLTALWFLIPGALALSGLFFTIAPAIVFVATLIICLIAKFIYNQKVNDAIQEVSLFDLVEYHEDNVLSKTLLEKKIKTMTPEAWDAFEKDFRLQENERYQHAPHASLLYSLLLTYAPTKIPALWKDFKKMAEQTGNKDFIFQLDKDNKLTRMDKDSKDHSLTHTDLYKNKHIGYVFRNHILKSFQQHIEKERIISHAVDNHQPFHDTQQSMIDQLYTDIKALQPGLKIVESKHSNRTHICLKDHGTVLFKIKKSYDHQRLIIDINTDLKDKFPLLWDSIKQNQSFYKEAELRLQCNSRSPEDLLACLLKIQAVVHELDQLNVSLKIHQKTLRIIKEALKDSPSSPIHSVILSLSQQFQSLHRVKRTLEH